MTSAEGTPPVEAQQTPTALPPGERWFQASVIIGICINPLNSALIAISLVVISRSLDVPLSHALWLIGGFYITSAIAQPIFGSLADRIAAYPMFMAGLTSVAVGAVLGGVAQDIITLTIARIIIALGTAATYPSAVVMIRQRYVAGPEGRPLRILAITAVSQQIAAAIGPPLGGLMVGAIGWRSAFLMNLPIALVTMLIARHVHRTAAAHRALTEAAAAEKPASPLYPVGSVLFALTLGLMFASTAETVLPEVVALGGFVIALVVLVLWEMRTPAPLIDVRLLAARLELSWIFVRFVMAGVVLYVIMLLWPQWLQQGRDLEVDQVGLLMLPMSVLGPGIAALAGRWLHYRYSLVLGHVGLLAGSALLLTMSGGTPIWVLVACVVCFALPTALLHLANQAAVFEAAPAEQTGASVGLLRSAWYIGAIIATALGGVFFGERATNGGLHDLGITMCVLTALIFVVDALFLVRRRITARDEAPSAAQG